MYEPTKWEQAKALAFVSAGAVVMLGAVVSVVTHAEEQRKRRDGYEARGR